MGFGYVYISYLTCVAKTIYILYIKSSLVFQRRWWMLYSVYYIYIQYQSKVWTHLVSHCFFLFCWISTCWRHQNYEITQMEHISSASPDGVGCWIWQMSRLVGTEAFWQALTQLCSNYGLMTMAIWGEHFTGYGRIWTNFLQCCWHAALPMALIFPVWIYPNS